MLGHGGSSASSYLAANTSPIPSHCAVIILCCSASIAVTGTVRVNVLTLSSLRIKKDTKKDFKVFN